MPFLIAISVGLLNSIHTQAAGDLYFSEYIEGSSNNKALEITNTTGATIDLSSYEVHMYFNGNSVASLMLHLSGFVDNNDVFVIANSRADTTIIDTADQTSGLNWFNGDDAIVLLNDGVIIDSIGQVGVDPGLQWGTGDTSTQNNTLRRIAPVKNGDTMINDKFDPTIEWKGFPQDSFNHLGKLETNNVGVNNKSVYNTSQCGDLATLISAIQGTGDISPLDSEALQVEAIVVGDFQGDDQLRGFYIQEEADDQDSLTATSEGLFVFSGNSAVDVNTGDLVRVSGSVKEFFGLTELTSLTDITICDSGLSLAPTAISFPVLSPDALESVESMLITIPQTMQVTEHFDLGRLNEVVLASERLFQPTHLANPGASANAQQRENDLKRIILDDTSTQKNPGTVTYPAPKLSALNTLRGGYSVANVTGIMSYSYSEYRILPTTAPNFLATNTRSVKPELSTEGNLTVASFNLLNYFNGDGQGGGFPTPRGADTLSEFKRQRKKIINALIAMDADIVGLVELENDGYGADSAIQDLVNGLNNVGQNYGFVYPGVPRIGDDDITVGFIYKVEQVETVNAAAILDSSVDNRFIDSKNRPALAQSFRVLDNQGVLTIVINHFKSKGSDCDDVGDPNGNDGQGNCNGTRNLAAAALSDWLDSDPTNSGDSDVLIIGDLNAYAKEDPITTLINAGFQDLTASMLGSNAYTFLFGGQLGYLDYAMANKLLQSQVVDLHQWHINADEPRALDYNVEFKSNEQVTSWYSPEPYRSSDHDPVMIRLNLKTSVER